MKSVLKKFFEVEEYSTSTSRTYETKPLRGKRAAYLWKECRKQNPELVSLYGEDAKFLRDRKYVLVIEDGSSFEAPELSVRRTSYNYNRFERAANVLLARAVRASNKAKKAKKEAIL